MFWGLILKANKKYTQTLEKPFHLTCAALDYSNADDDPVQVMYSDGQASYLLCTLQKNKDLQFRLDLTFNEGDKLCFMTKGNGIVHLSGYLIPEEDFDYDPNMMDDEDLDISDDASEEETEVPDLREKLTSKKKEKEKAKKEQPKKKAPVEEESSDEESDEELQNGNKSLDSSAAADEEDSDEEDDDDELDEEEGMSDDDESLEGEEESGEEDDSDEEEVEMPPKKVKLDPQAAKKQQKNGLENGQASQKKDKKDKQQQKDQKKENKPEQAQNNAVKKLQGGLLIQDLKPGNGAEAKPGKKIQVYYEGRLKANNKIFDATKGGPGFKLTLGRGEVIKGWDIGLAGMKVGGKRRITCPPGLAYGAKGNPPVIPANSTLVFDVELKNVL